MALQEIKANLDAVSLTKEGAGTKVKGYYIKKSTFKDKNAKEQYIYTVTSEEGKAVKFFGFTDLNRKFEGIAFNSYVEIEYLGKHKVENVKNEMHLSKIQVDVDRKKVEEVPY